MLDENDPAPEPAENDDFREFRTRPPLPSAVSKHLIAWIALACPLVVWGSQFLLAAFLTGRRYAELWSCAACFQGFLILLGPVFGIMALIRDRGEGDMRTFGPAVGGIVLSLATIGLIVILMLR